LIANSQSLSPVTPSEFDCLMSSIGYFEPNPTIAVATSGGADSMALLLLANEWSISKNGRIISLTVNHRLRPEADDETNQVSNWCAQHGIEHYTLYWEHDFTITSSVQESARNARYKLMTDWCVENNILHLLLAHHLEDQVETLFFRLARGSNMDGLSAMAAQTIISGVRLIRPFLQINKSRLIETLKFKDQKWIEDPSNLNSQYTRVHIRKQLLELVNRHDINQRSGQVISKFSKFRYSKQNELVSQITNGIGIFPEGYGLIDTSKFSLIETHTSAKILGKLIVALNGRHYPPRSQKLLKLAELIKNYNISKKYNIGGLIFEILPVNHIIVYREAKCIEKPCNIYSKTPILWDDRFIVKWSANDVATTCLQLRALGTEGLMQLKKAAPCLLNNQVPARVLRTMPSLWLLEQLVSVPHINYINNSAGVKICKVNIKLSPVKPLAGSSFFVMNMDI
jgi:tRNA(Ile)-lysidine synthase